MMPSVQSNQTFYVHMSRLNSLSGLVALNYRFIQVKNLYTAHSLSMDQSLELNLITLIANIGLAITLPNPATALSQSDKANIKQSMVSMIGHLVTAVCNLPSTVVANHSDAVQAILSDLSALYRSIYNPH